MSPELWFQGRQSLSVSQRERHSLCQFRYQNPTHAADFHLHSWTTRVIVSYWAFRYQNPTHAPGFPPTLLHHQSYTEVDLVPYKIYPSACITHLVSYKIYPSACIILRLTPKLHINSSCMRVGLGEKSPHTQVQCFTVIYSLSVTALHWGGPAGDSLSANQGTEHYIEVDYFIMLLISLSTDPCLSWHPIAVGSLQRLLHFYPAVTPAVYTRFVSR